MIIFVCLKLAALACLDLAVLLACYIVCTAYVVKFDSTVAKTGTTQIIRRGHIHLKNNHNIIIIIIIIIII